MTVPSNGLRWSIVANMVTVAVAALGIMFAGWHWASDIQTAQATTQAVLTQHSTSIQETSKKVDELQSGIAELDTKAAVADKGQAQITNQLDKLSRQLDTLQATATPRGH